MDFDSVTFFLDDVHRWKHWFINVLGFTSRCPSSNVDSPVNRGRSPSPQQSVIATLHSQDVCIHLTEPTSTPNAAAKYLHHHPAGVGDLAFRVSDVDSAYEQALDAGAIPIQTPMLCQTVAGPTKQAIVSGWGDVNHTLVEHLAQSNSPSKGLSSTLGLSDISRPPSDLSPFLAIDHAVLNVPVGEMEKAVAWYARAFGFECKQTFSIHTPRSALRSMVLTHPNGTATLPINEPASANSQIQEFLDVNRGAGIQHIALATHDIVQAMSQFRQNGLDFLTVPTSYYEQLPFRPGFQKSRLSHSLDWGAIARHGVLVDWQKEMPDALLLQAFTQPIFGEPTFFFEIIQRQRYRTGTFYKQAEGFGEGNFQALFEAIEREQLKRGSLPV
jgi:4-hydroxyphenylpyruvate dioxygenase